MKGLLSVSDALPTSHIVFDIFCTRFQPQASESDWLSTFHGMHILMLQFSSIIKKFEDHNTLSV